MASQKAMSEGERLAEYILDDLVQEVVLDFQRIEEEDEAEEEAAFMCDQVDFRGVSCNIIALIFGSSKQIFTHFCAKLSENSTLRVSLLQPSDCDCLKEGARENLYVEGIKISSSAR